MIEALGGWKRMKPKIERFEITDPELLALTSKKMDQWLNSWTLEGHMKYGGQYVAVSADKRVVASDKSSSRLAKKLRPVYVRTPTGLIEQDFLLRGVQGHV
jgi:hypothetical protein